MFETIRIDQIIFLMLIFVGFVQPFTGEGVIDGDIYSDGIPQIYDDGYGKSDHHGGKYDHGHHGKKHDYHGHHHGYGGHGHDGHGHDYGHHSIDAAVNSKHSVDTYKVHTNADHKTPVVDINSGPLTLKIRFNSHSTNIVSKQKHHGSPGKVKHSHSIDEPDILIHNVKKPVIQEIKEIITPYRKRVQEIKPVKERVETLVPTGHGDYGGHGHGDYGGHGHDGHGHDGHGDYDGHGHDGHGHDGHGDYGGHGHDGHGHDGHGDYGGHGHDGHGHDGHGDYGYDDPNYVEGKF